jgi:hypothetical protein
MSDLDQIQQEVNASRKRFLEAYDLYQSDGHQEASFFITNYIRPFREQSTGHPELVREYAEKIQKEIEGFQDVTSSMLSDIADINMRVNLTVNSATLAAIKITLDDFTEYLDDVAARLMNPAGQRPLQASSESIEKKIARIRKRVATIGEHVAAVQNVSADVILLRLNALKEFRKEKLEVSNQVILQRIKNSLKDAALDEIRDFVLEIIKGYFEDILHITAIKRVLDKAREVSKPVAGTSIGDTDTFLSLYTILKKHHLAIEELSSVIAKAREDYDTLDAELKAITSS